MILITVILAGLSTLSSLICLLFTNKDNWTFLLVKNLTLISLLCFSIAMTSYKNAFSGFSIFLILSIIPMFLESLSSELQTTTIYGQNKENLNSNTEISSKNLKNNQNFEKIGLFLSKLAYPLSSLCLAISGLYIGKETPFSFLFGIAFAFAMTFIYFIFFKKKIKLNSKGVEFISTFLVFLGSGFALGCVIPVFLYEISLKTIMFNIGIIVYSLFFFFKRFVNKKFDYIFYVLGTVLILSSILF